ncbi:hypothetical protein GXW82_44470 [Streptacidiphilus sp. 4-A2]|nr:hypothetical protein [Streptacidiphilus sp. 4-A2]
MNAIDLRVGDQLGALEVVDTTTVITSTGTRVLVTTADGSSSTTTARTSPPPRATDHRHRPADQPEKRTPMIAIRASRPARRPARRRVRQELIRTETWRLVASTTRPGPRRRDSR